MKETLLTVLENTRLAEGIYRLRLTGDTPAETPQQPEPAPTPDPEPETPTIVVTPDSPSET